jgi:hypothetical protein
MRTRILIHSRKYNLYILHTHTLPKIIILIFVSWTLPKTITFLYLVHKHSRTRKNVYIRRRNTPENNNIEKLKPQETYALAAGLPVCVTACLPRSYNVMLNGEWPKLRSYALCDICCNQKIVTIVWTYSSNGWHDVHTELCGETCSEIVT